MPLKDLFTRKKNPAPASPSGAAAGGKGNEVEGMFESYKESYIDSIGPEGIMRLCADMGIEPTDVRLLVLAWQVRAAEQGYLTRSEWMQGMQSLRADSPQTLLARLQTITQSLRASTTTEPFKDFYKFAFRFSRTAGQKSLEIDTVKVLLPIVLPPHHPHLQKLLQFLDSGAGASVKAFNEDQWTSFLLFSNQIATDFSNFDVDGAWPSLLDDYVSYAQA